jgi:hypothetical protein
MGGVEQPVIDGVISIESVNGDIVITAIAKEIEQDFTITYNLTNCTSSNTIPGINRGESFDTTISVPNGYRLNTITCTMNGVEQTVTNGVISIESVNGDIVITAVATEIMLEYVTDGLSVHYSPDSFDIDNLAWTDECGTGNTLTAKSTSGATQTGWYENQKVMTMKKFTELFSNGWSICITANSTNNNMIFSLNNTSANGNHPYATRVQFLDAASNTIAIGSPNGIKHYTFIYSSDTGTYTVYLDGVKKGTVQKTTALNTNTSSYFSVGGWGVDTFSIRVYNRPLTEEEVQQNYACESKKWTLDA